MTSERPAFRGLSVHRDLRHKFSLLYPQGWTPVELPKHEGGGTVFYPDPADGHTSLLVRGARLRRKVRPDDIDTLREGMVEGLHQLSGVEVESADARSVGNLIDLQSRHTYRGGDAVRKRWLRLLYQGTVQITLIAQGASPERFDYWLPMFTSAMHTVQFADWWAEITGVSWLRRLDIAPQEI
jgi:hypothetical protein